MRRTLSWVRRHGEAIVALTVLAVMLGTLVVGCTMLAYWPLGWILDGWVRLVIAITAATGTAAMVLDTMLGVSPRAQRRQQRRQCRTQFPSREGWRLGPPLASLAIFAVSQTVWGTGGSGAWALFVTIWIGRAVVVSFRIRRGLRLRTLLTLLRARKARWEGYEPNGGPCPQCRGTGKLRSRLFDTTYRCNACRPTL